MVNLWRTDCKRDSEMCSSNKISRCGKLGLRLTFLCSFSSYLNQTESFLGP